ncbi:hypothetical protein EVAR_43720_1 [Eumeta japonica]|uniref:Uncharacterized protein n=1 Tax=Eumeta variegata TaxID=151549 RepID=A0A4C1Y257_EUMVA|nr:hypothetical protein EVAR_43720_1 [Eumeta japonica]
MLVRRELRRHRKPELFSTANKSRKLYAVLASSLFLLAGVEMRDVHRNVSPKELAIDLRMGVEEGGPYHEIKSRRKHHRRHSEVLEKLSRGYRASSQLVEEQFTSGSRGGSTYQSRGGSRRTDPPKLQRALANTFVPKVGEPQVTKLVCNLNRNVNYRALRVRRLDEGHGRWKHMNREEMDQKIAALKLMADKLQHEIDDYYYEDSKLEDGSVHYNKKENVERISRIKNSRTKIFQSLPKNSNNITSVLPKYTEDKVENDAIENNEIENRGATESEKGPKTYGSGSGSKPTTIAGTRWPSFEEILLAMGKKYDWKNDRWLKTKKEQKGEDRTVAKGYVDRLEFLSKHKFSYRTVKLNRVKTKRNIVIAVTAVR